MNIATSSAILAAEGQAARREAVRAGAAADALFDSLRDHWPLATARRLADALAKSGVLPGTPGFADRLPGMELVRKDALRRRVLAGALRVSMRRAGGGAAEMLSRPRGGQGVARVYFGQSRGSLPPSVIAHMYEDRALAKSAFAAMKALRRNGLDGASGDGRIARPVAHLLRWRTILREDASGAALTDLPDDKQAAGAAAIGRLLARLHRSPQGIARAGAAPHNAAELQAQVALAIEVMPFQLAAIAGAHAEVRRGLAVLPPHEPALIHGNFRPSRLLIEGEGAVLLDCAGMGLGDPARDLGGFLAHLRLLTLRGGELWPETELAFLQGYGGLTKALEARTIAYLKAELLALACRYALSTRERSLVRPLLRYIGDEVPVLAG